MYVCTYTHTRVCIQICIYTHMYSSAFLCQQERPLLKKYTRLIIILCSCVCVCVSEYLCFIFAAMGKYDRTHHNHIMGDESYTFSSGT